MTYCLPSPSGQSTRPNSAAAPRAWSSICSRCSRVRLDRHEGKDRQLDDISGLIEYFLVHLESARSSVGSSTATLR